MKRYDIVLFGYTGYTGKFIFEELYRQSERENLTYAVAGRNLKKIQECLEESALYLENTLVTNTPVIYADIKDQESIIEMTKKATVVINAVGPYRFYGEQVVQACIENGVHHVDISGEPQYLEKMQLQYHKKAEEQGVYVVGACGLDSIPPEIGIKFISDQFQGNINEVEYYLVMKTSKDMKIHFTTWESAIYGFAHQKELSPIRKELFPEKITKPKYSQQRRSLLFYSDEVKRWCLPFLGSDKSVVRRSQYFLHFAKDIRPVQFNAYITFSSILATVFTILIGGIFGLFSKFSCGRYLLLNFPKIFSLGTVSVEGASRKAVKNSKMEVVLIGKGWENQSSIDTTKPNRKIICSINGPEGGYLSCSIFVVQAAITIIRERNKMPNNGGVYSPLAAFYDTAYLERLQENDIHFTKISDSMIKE